MKPITISKIFFGKPMNYRNVNAEAVAEMGTIVERADALKVILKKDLSRFSSDLQALVRSIPTWEQYEAFAIDGTHYLTALSGQADVATRYTVIQPKDIESLTMLRATQMRYNQTTRTTAGDNYRTIIAMDCDATTISKEFGLPIATANALVYCKGNALLSKMIETECLYLPKFIELVNYCLANKVAEAYIKQHLETLLHDCTMTENEVTRYSRMTEQQSTKFVARFIENDKETKKMVKQQQKEQQEEINKAQAKLDEAAFIHKVSEMIEEGIPFIVLKGRNGKDGKTAISVQADLLLEEDKRKDKRKRVTVKDYTMDATIVKQTFKIDQHHHRLYPAGTLFVNGYIESNNEHHLLGILPNGETTHFLPLEYKTEIAQAVIDAARAAVAEKKEMTALQKAAQNTTFLMEQHTNHVLPKMEQLAIYNLVEAMPIIKMGAKCPYTIMRESLKHSIQDGSVATMEMLIQDERFIHLCYCSVSYRLTNSQENSVLRKLSMEMEEELRLAQIVALEEDGVLTTDSFSVPVMNSYGNENDPFEEMTDDEKEEYVNRVFETEAYDSDALGDEMREAAMKEKNERK